MQNGRLNEGETALCAGLPGHGAFFFLKSFRELLVRHDFFV